MQPIRRRSGMTLIEVLIVITMIGLMAAVVVPRFRVSKSTRVRQAADVLVRDLEQARTRALSTRSRVRVNFVAASNSYTGYLDFNRDTLFAMSTAERDSLRGFGTRTLTDGVVIGRGGSTPDLPSITGSGAITFTGGNLNFDSRGLTWPFGTSGVIYLTHTSDPTAVAAVGVTAGGAIRRWIYRGGTWQ
ncbi:MAG TPA: type II secretion system protein [Gemmatimonadales bacterium]|nr:type II secretion system protein [Gemmatimonadales bacterium]